MQPLRPLSLALAVCLAACGDDSQSGRPESGATAAASASVGTESGALPAPRGSIEGLIVFEGTPPARLPINTAAEGGCGLDPNEPALTEAWVVEGGRLANVFVWLGNPPPEPQPAPETLSPLQLRQRGCLYRPHAIGVRAGQTLRISNEDRARHNVRTMPRRDQNPSINQTQAEAGPALDVVFKEPEVAVAIVCDLHPWMKAWVGVFEHRFFHVTEADGHFGWSGLPPGEYEVNAWHEVLGRLKASAVVTEENGASVRITFRRKD